MPRDGSNVYAPPAGTAAVSGTTVESAKYNAFVSDLTSDLNAARPISAGGTGSTTASAARTALGLEIGTDVQAYDAGLADSDAVNIDGGAIDGTPIGAASASTGAFTTLKTNSTDPVAPAKLGTIYVATVGGSANARTFTTGLSLPALVKGMTFLAEFPAANTGSMTINIDGLGAKTVKTPPYWLDGLKKDTPSGFIRTDVPTQLYYDGTNLIASRAEEGGSDVTNGRWTRFENGRQVCSNRTSAGATWTYAKAFLSGEIPVIGAVAFTTVSAWRGVTYDAVTNTSVYIEGWNLAGGTVTPFCHGTAEGAWY